MQHSVPKIDLEKAKDRNENEKKQPTLVPTDSTTLEVCVCTGKSFGNT